jgi:hypothetical protein
LIARFDREALHVTPPAGYRPGTLRAEQMAAWQWLEAWCFEGAGDGRSPPPQPFGVAVLAGPPGAGRSHLAEAYSRHLDGDLRLQALPAGWPRLRLRLAVKLAESLPGRRRQPGDPWDCGYLGSSAAALQALRRFQPRRATLMVADELPEAVLADCIAALAPRQAGFGQPVRLLVIAAGAAWAINRA